MLLWWLGIFWNYNWLLDDRGQVSRGNGSFRSRLYGITSLLSSFSPRTCPPRHHPQISRTPTHSWQPELLVILKTHETRQITQLVFICEANLCKAKCPWENIDRDLQWACLYPIAGPRHFKPNSDPSNLVNPASFLQSMHHNYLEGGKVNWPTSFPLPGTLRHLQIIKPRTDSRMLLTQWIFLPQSSVSWPRSISELCMVRNSSLQDWSGSVHLKSAVKQSWSNTHPIFFCTGHFFLPINHIPLI